MAPILYFLEISPPVRSVLLTAAAIDLKLELKNIDLFKREHLTTEFLEVNPQHTIPTLDDNGFILWESHAIVIYLVKKYGKNDSLYPKDLDKKAIIDQRLHFCSGVLYPRLRAIFVPILFEGLKEISAENEIGMKQTYALMESFLQDHKYFAGNQLSVADFCAISMISTAVPVIPFDVVKFPNLKAWINRMKNLPYYQGSNGKAAEKVSLMVNKLLERC